ncbi:MAG: DUF4384 domain-containing protein [Myxococcaceae bacterium]
MNGNELPALRRRRADACLSNLALDRLLAGELDGQEQGKSARAHLELCSECSARYRELTARQAGFPQEVWVAGEVARAKRRTRGPQLWRVAGPTLGLAAAAALLLVVVPQVEEGSERIKGGLSLRVFKRNTAGAVTELASGESAAAGDQLRLEVGTPRMGYVRVVGIDSAGHVTVYYPEKGEEIATAPIGKTMLPGSIVLDDTAGTERLVALLCETPVDVARVREAAERALREGAGSPQRVGRLGLSCEQVMFEVHKDTAR